MFICTLSVELHALRAWRCWRYQLIPLRKELWTPPPSPAHSRHTLCNINTFSKPTKFSPGNIKPCELNKEIESCLVAAKSLKLRSLPDPFFSTATASLRRDRAMDRYLPDRYRPNYDGNPCLNCTWFHYGRCGSRPRQCWTCGDWGHIQRSRTDRSNKKKQWY